MYFFTVVCMMCALRQAIMDTVMVEAEQSQWANLSASYDAFLRKSRTFQETFSSAFWARKRENTNFIRFSAVFIFDIFGFGCKWLIDKWIMTASMFLFFRILWWLDQFGADIAVIWTCWNCSNHMCGCTASQTDIISIHSIGFSSVKFECCLFGMRTWYKRRSSPSWGQKWSDFHFKGKRFLLSAP